MLPYQRHPNSGGSFQQLDGPPGIRVLRLFSSLESLARQTAGWISRWCRRRADARKLQALSDHYLRDVGLDRSQIVSPFERIIETRGETVARITRQCPWWS